MATLPRPYARAFELKTIFYRVWLKDDTVKLSKLRTELCEHWKCSMRIVKDHLIEFEREGIIKVDHSLGWAWMNPNWAKAIEQNLGVYDFIGDKNETTT